MTSPAKKNSPKPRTVDKRITDKVTKAVAAIVLDDPFYGYLLLRMEVVPDFSIDTACTNGKQIRYSPEFVDKLTLGQLKGLMKHEVMHVAHMHHLRRAGRDMRKWNVATDLVINAHLIEAGCELPEGGLVDKKYADFSAEHVYSLLPDEPDGPGRLPGQQPDNGGFPPPWDFGGVEDHPDGQTETERQQLEEEVKLDVIQAANAAKLMGKEPLGIERLIDKIRQSKMPWRKILARFFRATSKDDQSWMRPNRRFLPYDIYLPSAHGTALGPLVIGVDTSGSISGDEITKFFGEINAILKQTKPQSVHVVYCDAQVHSAQVFTMRDLPLKVSSFKPKGGGGTAFAPVFDYVKEQRLKPVALLYLTDMYGSFPDKAPAYPTIWCATSEIKAPFGKTLEIN